MAAGSAGDQERTGRELPGLIRDLHTSVAAGRDVAELYEPAALLHTEECDRPITLGLAAAGAVRVMLSTGAFDLAQAELDSVTVPTTTPEMMQLDGVDQVVPR